MASASPRRKELLSYIADDFTVKVSNCDETVGEDIPPLKRPEAISLKKAKAVADGYSDDIIIAADTAVFSDGKMLGKPKDVSDAKRMLFLLSGKTHTVVTGVTVIKGGYVDSFSVSTQVEFYPLSDAEISDYIATGEPMDKAGAYGIQEKGRLFVKSINGDYYNVVGLPVAELYRHIKNL